MLKKLINIALDASNIAHLGGVEEHEAKKKSAGSDKAWDGAGKKVGVETWRVHNKKNDFGVVREDSTGSFYSGDSYIVLHTYKEKKSNNLSWDLFFWLGKESSQDELGVAAYKSVELDTLLNDGPVQHRVVQGHEPKAFLQLFPCFTIYSGGYASGFHHVKPTEYKTRLLQIKGSSEKTIRVREVPAKLESLNHGDVFVLDNGLKLFQWNGTDSTALEKRRGNQLVTHIKSSRMGRPSKDILDGEEEDDVFWELLGGKGKDGGKGKVNKAVPDSPKHARRRSTQTVPVKALFQLSDASGKLSLSEVKLSKASINDEDVFILDKGKGQGLNLYVGSKASFKEKARSFDVCISYLKSQDRDLNTAIVRFTATKNIDAFLKY